MVVFGLELLIFWSQRSQKWWFFTFFGRKQPMRRELANSCLKAKIQIKQIGGFTKSLSQYGRVWTWIAYLLKLIPNMNLKISISRIFENVTFFLLNPHRAFACMRGGWRGSRVDVFSSFLASKSYQNINFDQIKDRDINLVIIYLIFDQNWNFLATHVDARSQKWWVFTFFGRKQPMRRAANWQTRLWKLKFKSNKLVEWRNLYPNMVVFGLELLIFWSWFRIWTWKYRFPEFSKMLIFFSLTHTVHLHACAVDREAAE